MPPVIAQEVNWNALNAEISELSRNAQWQDAEKMALKALDMAKETFGRAHYKTGISLRQLSLIYRALDKNDKAVESSHEAIRIWEKAVGPQHSHVIAVGR